MATVTSYIDSVNGDATGTGGVFNSLTNWISNGIGTTANLVTSTTTHIGKIRNSHATHFTLPATITCDGTYNITLMCDTGLSFYDNASKATNELRADSAHGIYMTWDGSGGGIGAVSCSNFTLDGLQFYATSNILLLDASASTATNITIRNCIFDGTQTSANPQIVRTYSGKVVNTLFINRSNGHGVSSRGGATTFRNCTAVALGGTAAGVYGFHSTTANVATAMNCAAFGFNACFNTIYATGSDYNASSDTTAVGTHTIKSLALADVGFGSVAADATRDFRITNAASTLIGAGVADTTYTSDLDIVKQARSTGAAPSGPTIGAWEYGAGAPTLVEVAPTADVVGGAGNWTPSTGAALYECINEASYSDTDYIQSGANPTADVCKVKFTTLQTPSANTNHTIKYRIKRDGGVALKVTLKAGDSPTNTTIKEWNHTGLGGGGDASGGNSDATWTEYDQTLTTGEADNWAAAGYPNSELWFTAG